MLRHFVKIFLLLVQLGRVLAKGLEHHIMVCHYPQQHDLHPVTTAISDKYHCTLKAIINKITCISIVFWHSLAIRWDVWENGLLEIIWHLFMTWYYITLNWYFTVIGEIFVQNEWCSLINLRWFRSCWWSSLWEWRRRCRRSVTQLLVCMARG